MSLRISSTLALALALAGCGAEQTSPPPPGDTVECAIGAGAELSAVCTLERVAASGEIIIHHPDGGFRRLGRDAQSGALIPLDGAELLVPEEGGANVLAFAVGTDRYRIPGKLLEPPAR